MLTDTEGHHDNRGSELGKTFLKVSSDIADRFTQYCGGNCEDAFLQQKRYDAYLMIIQR